MGTLFHLQPGQAEAGQGHEDRAAHGGQGETSGAGLYVRATAPQRMPSVRGCTVEQESESDMSDDKEPVDLINIRWCAGALAVRDMPGTAKQMYDMADEIELLREAVAQLLGVLCHSGMVSLKPDAQAIVANYRSLLPTA